MFLGIFHNYAYVPEQQGTIHSHLQLQDAGNLVCDTATQIGGHSQIDSNDGYNIPICFCHGLPYIKYYPPTDEEVVTLDQIIMTSPGHWDPSKYDDVHFYSNELMKRIPTTPMEATNDFYNRNGNIVETNCSEQQLETITWADQIHPTDDDSLYTMPSLQHPQFNDNDSSGDEYSYSTNKDASMPVLHSFPDDG